MRQTQANLRRSDLTQARRASLMLAARVFDEQCPGILAECAKVETGEMPQSLEAAVAALVTAWGRDGLERLVYSLPGDYYNA
jgi:hypothetical protein